MRCSTGLAGDMVPGNDERSESFSVGSVDAGIVSILAPGSFVDTAATVMGLRRTVLLASALMMTLAATIPLPTFFLFYGRLYLWVMESAVVPGLIAASYLLLKRPEKQTFSRVSWLLKIEMFFGVLAVGLGKI